MRKQICAAICGFTMAAGAALAQTGQGELIDILRVRIKPEKRVEYETAVRKMIELNRKGGSRWLAYGTGYGDTGTLYFASQKKNWAEVESTGELFRKAMLEGLGSGMPKFFADLNAITNSMQSEIRRRRWDLSVNMPSDDTERMRVVANAKYLRTIRVELKPGRMPEWVEAWKPWQAELGRLGPKLPAAVSVSATGRPVVVIATYFRDMAEMDAGEAVIGKVLGGDVYRNFQRNIADLTVSTNWEIHRFLPELSCAPEEIVSMNPEFWQPKTAAARMKKSAPAPKKQ